MTTVLAIEANTTSKAEGDHYMLRLDHRLAQASWIKAPSLCEKQELAKEKAELLAQLPPLEHQKFENKSAETTENSLASTEIQNAVTSVVLERLHPSKTKNFSFI